MADGPTANSTDIGALRTLICAIMDEMFLRYEQGQSRLDQLVFTEEEAAKALGLNKRQLADERRRKRICASRIVGRQVRYLREDLLEYMRRRRINDPNDPPRIIDNRRTSIVRASEREQQITPTTPIGESAPENSAEPKTERRQTTTAFH